MGGETTRRESAIRPSRRRDGGVREGRDLREKRLPRMTAGYVERTASGTRREKSSYAGEEGPGRRRGEAALHPLMVLLLRRLSSRTPPRKREATPPAVGHVSARHVSSGKPLRRDGEKSSGAVRREMRSGARRDLAVVRGGKAVGPESGGERKAHGARREGRGRRTRRRRAVALVGLILVLALASAVLYRPVVRYLESRRELASTEARLAEERALTRGLEERRDFASSERYVEGEARRMGYVKPGEIPLVVLDDKEGAVEGEVGIEEEGDKGNQAASP